MKKVLKWIGIILGVIIVVAAGYIAYVFLSFDRIEDDQTLTVRHGGKLEEKTVPAGKELTITSSNIGFGAYSDDYTFFMDGGKESRARSVGAIEENIAGSMDAVGNVTPDFALVQEVDIGGTRSLHVNERELVTCALLRVPVVGDEVGRRLDVGFGAQQDAGDGDGGGEVFEVGVGPVAQRGVRFGAEVLHDDFLDRAVLAGDLADREDRVDAFREGFADADEDARGEGDRGASRVFEDAQPHHGVFVRAAVVDLAAFRE